MSDMLVVNFAGLHGASSNIELAIKTLNEQLGELERAAAPLVTGWDGDAKAAYETRQKQWRTAASELTAMLGQIKRALDESAAEYKNTEDRNRQMFE